MRKIAFIINPISGKGHKDAIPQMIRKHIDNTLYRTDIYTTQYAGHATELAARCVDDHYDVVVAVGGDGTVNEVARAVATSDTALAILPCGSGNGLARHLMLPMHLGSALDIINTCEVHALDYGTINQYPFFCTCGMGFDAHISQKFAEAGKRGRLTYLENVLREGVRYQPESYHIIIDGEDIGSYDAFLITIANASQFGNDAYIAPHASMTDGLLDVVIMKPFDIIQAPEVGIALMNKTLDMTDRTVTLLGKDVLIRRDTSGVIHYDGEPTDAPADLHIRIHQKMLRVVVNPMADKRQRQPNMLQSAIGSLLYEMRNIGDGVSSPGKRVKAINNFIQRRLS